MTIRKVYVNKDNEATVVCPYCGLTKTINTSKYRSIRKALKVKCKCLESFDIILEYRRFYRKDTDLEGTYTTNSGTFSMVVKSLSLGGVGFTVFSYDRIRLEIDDIITLDFVLDDKNKSNVTSRVNIIRINGNYVGAEFLELDEDTKKKLGFYLMF